MGTIDIIIVVLKSPLNINSTNARNKHNNEKERKLLKLDLKYNASRYIPIKINFKVVGVNLLISNILP
jgi:hypothetical protein